MKYRVVTDRSIENGTLVCRYMPQIKEAWWTPWCDKCQYLGCRTKESALAVIRKDKKMQKQLAKEGKRTVEEIE